MKYYNIAGLNIQIEGAEYDYFKLRLKEYEVEKFLSPDISFKFILDNCINQALPKPFATKSGRNYFNTDDCYGFYDYITEIDKTVSIMKANKNWVDFTYTFSDLTNIFSINPATTVFNVAGHLFSNAIKGFSGVVVHASTIVFNDKAVTFTAPSGTGKSTHTGLWKKYYPDTVVINDDMPAVRLIDDEFFAYGTPWSGKTDINTNMSAPLHAMVFIERADNCSIEKISPMDALLRMLREIPISVFKQQSDLQLDLFNKLFMNVPSYLLKCNISKDAVDTVKNMLF